MMPAAPDKRDPSEADIHKKDDHDPPGGRTQQAGFAGQGDQEERIHQIDGQEVHGGEDKGLHQGADQPRGPGQGQREDAGVLEGSAPEVEAGSVIVKEAPPWRGAGCGRLLLLAESHLTRCLFGAMLQRIWALPLPAG